jgi:isopenicillin N synthase-like dioxygenase
VFDRCRALFALPLEEKRKMLQDENNRGWTPYGEETLDPDNQTKGDTKEGFYFGRDIPADDPEAALPLHGPNVWPREDLVPGFRAAAEEYMAKLTDLGRRLVKLVAESLGLPPAHFDAAFTRPMTFLRPLRYDAAEASAPDAGVFGAGAHTDYGMLTLLATDGQPGLQIFLPQAGDGGDGSGGDSGGDKGVWADVPPVSGPETGMFVVNLGDMLERWTNGRYRSTLHRVVSGGGSERFSIPFFFEVRIYD